MVASTFGNGGVSYRQRAVQCVDFWKHAASRVMLRGCVDMRPLVDSGYAGCGSAIASSRDESSTARARNQILAEK